MFKLFGYDNVECNVKIPEIFKNIITVNKHKSVSYFPYNLLNESLVLIAEELKDDGVSDDQLAQVNILITNDVTITMSFYNDVKQYPALYNSFIVLFNDVLFKKEDIIYLFAITEELTHHFWHIMDERLVKEKVIRILNRKYYNITMNDIKKWGIDI